MSTVDVLSPIARIYAQWRRKNFPRGTQLKQLLKFDEEVGELHAALYRDDAEATRDALGDIFLAWLGLCEILEHPPGEAALAAWHEIKDRDYTKYPNGRTT